MSERNTYIFEFILKSHSSAIIASVFFIIISGKMLSVILSEAIIPLWASIFAMFNIHSSHVPKKMEVYTETYTVIFKLSFFCGLLHVWND